MNADHVELIRSSITCKETNKTIELELFQLLTILVILRIFIKGISLLPLIRSADILLQPQNDTKPKFLSGN